MLAVLAPGQGAQKPGMLTDWLDLPGAESFFRWAGAIADADLLTLGTTGDAEAIKDTAVTQPLVVAMSLFIARELGGMPGPVAHTPHAGRDVVIAGHSVGELTAAALAGVLSVEAAIALTAVRGRAMAAACAQTPTGMSAVLGGDPDEVLAAHRAARPDARPTGTAPARSSPPARSTGSRRSRPTRRPRPGSCRCRSPAPSTPPTWPRPARSSRASSAASGPADPSRLLLSNADGAAVDSGAEVAVAGWSARSPARCAATPAWPPCATSASPPSSSCRRPARWPAWPSASGRARASRCSR